MFYVIDYDSRKVESKSEDEELLATYIIDNDLHVAVALVGSVKDLNDLFSTGELADIYNNLNKNATIDKDDIAEYCWSSLTMTQDRFPTFTKALGVKLLSSKSVTFIRKAPKKKAKVKWKTIDDIIDSVYIIGTVPPTRGKHKRIVEFIDENIGSVTGEELIDFLEFEDDNPRQYISDALTKNFIEEDL